MRSAFTTALLCLSVISATVLSGAAGATEVAKPKPTAQKATNKSGASTTKSKSAATPAKSGVAKTSTVKSSAKKKTSVKTGVSASKKSGAVAAAGAVAVSQDPSRLAVHSGAALVIEQGGEQTFYQKNADAIMPIASITKLMTAMVVLDGVPDLQAPVTISAEDVDYLKGSRSRLNVGATMTREMALLLALMSSENRASHALARHYPGGVPAFLAAMNVKAQALGMRETRFEDPTGLNSHNVSTAHDLAKMVAAAHRYPLIREFSTTPEAVIDISGRDMAFRNTNPLVKNSAWDVGLSKTGYISEAGKCLVMQARVAEKPVVIVLLDSVGKLTRVGDANRIKRWMEHSYAARKAPTQTVLNMRQEPPG